MSVAGIGIGMTSQRTRERLIQRLRDEGIRDARVLDRIRSTPRHLFVDEALASRAYEDTALPIGKGQTISQPYIVARMTEVLLAAGPLENVLEVGTGSGYQTAVLAPMVRRIYTDERIKLLLDQAAAESDREARKALYDEAAKLIVDDASYVYLYNPPIIHGMSPNVEGYSARGDAAIRFRDVSLSE